MKIHRIRIGDLVNKGILEFGDGYRTKRSELGQSGYRIIRVADVLDGVVKLDGPDCVAKEYEAKIGAKYGRPGDILLTTKGTVGRVAVMPTTDNPVVYSPQLCFFRVKDDSILNRGFLRYWFNSQEFWQQASYRMNNTDMAAYINLADLRSMEISLPSLKDQLSIVEVLGALDDKITANNELATAADDLARALFRQALKSATYSDESFADLAKVSGGGTPSTKKPEYWDGTIPWATPTDVTSLSGPYLEETSRTISEMGLKYCSSALHPAGSILMTSRATIGAFALAQVPTAVNQGFIVVQPNDPSLRFWLFHEMRSRVDEFISLANGATFLELSRGNFKKFKVRKATPETMAAFNETAETLHDSARAALLENNSLAATRDALLPQLMSGKIRVREAESIVEDVL